jgi:hypothetical protein
MRSIYNLIKKLRSIISKNNLILNDKIKKIVLLKSEIKIKNK